jgi:Transposase, Mutator family
MARDQSALLRGARHTEGRRGRRPIRSAATTIYQALIEAGLTAVIGAAPHERTDARPAQHNDSRPRTLTTRQGDVELRYHLGLPRVPLTPLPVRPRPRERDQPRAQAAPEGVPARRDRGRPAGRSVGRCGREELRDFWVLPLPVTEGRRPGGQRHRRRLASCANHLGHCQQPIGEPAFPDIERTLPPACSRSKLTAAANARHSANSDVVDKAAQTAPLPR